MHTSKTCDLPIHLSVFKEYLSFYWGIISFESNQLKSEHGSDIFTACNLDIWVGILAGKQKTIIKQHNSVPVNETFTVYPPLENLS